jgi:hypothetical protein
MRWRAVTGMLMACVCGATTATGAEQRKVPGPREVFPFGVYAGGNKYLMLLNTDVDKAQPCDIEFGYFQQYLDPKDGFYDVLTGERNDYKSIKQQTLAPGTGRFFLIGQAEALKRHQAAMRKAD